MAALSGDFSLIVNLTQQCFTAILSVLIFTSTQIAFPLVILYAIDNALVKGKLNEGVLEICAMIFAYLH